MGDTGFPRNYPIFGTTPSAPSDVRSRAGLADTNILSALTSTTMSALTSTSISGLTNVSTMVGDGNSTEPEDNNGWVPQDTLIGLVLAISSCFFIGTSVIFKKQSLQELQERGDTRAVDGGFGYLKAVRWWLGISLMGVGELTNFVAYIFAPAILVTPLGVFSIVITAALSPFFLKEKLGSLGRLGCVLVLVGCFIVTLCGPKDREVSTMEELEQQLLNPGFVTYSVIVIVVSIILMMMVPRYGHKYVMLYITICSCFGSLSVMFCKGVGLALKSTIMGNNAFGNWATWVCFISLIVCLVIETVYMQKALDLFHSSVFMSVNYVMFTSLVIIASSILYTEFNEIGWKNVVLTILGFIVNIGALYLLHLDRKYEEPQKAKTDEEYKFKSNSNLSENVRESKEITEPIFENRQEGSAENCSTPPSHTPLITPERTPSSPAHTTPSPSSAPPSEPPPALCVHSKSNSCLSLISETCSGKINGPTNLNTINRSNNESSIAKNMHSENDDDDIDMDNDSHNSSDSRRSSFSSHSNYSNSSSNHSTGSVNNMKKLSPKVVNESEYASGYMCAVALRNERISTIPGMKFSHKCPLSLDEIDKDRPSLTQNKTGRSRTDAFLQSSA